MEFPLIPTPDTNCINWPGDINKDGYGFVSVKGNVALVTRLIMKANKYQEVMHSCDNPRCINPDHLILGTHKENMLDAQAKKRMTWGEKHKQTTLTNEEVLLMRKEDRINQTYKAIAKKYNVSEATAYNIINYKTWRHLDNDFLLKEFIERVPEQSEDVFPEEGKVPG